MRALLALLAVLALPGVAHGQDGASTAPEPVVEPGVPTPPAMPPGEDRIESLELGARAPFRGMILDTDTAIRWTNGLRWWPHEFGLQLRAHRREIAALTESCLRQLRIVEESYGREVEGLRTDIRDQAQTFVRSLERPFYDTFGFGLALGLIVAAVFAGVGIGLGFAL